ncbi:MAG: hypothetical protein J7K54_04805 [Candidatus Aenigmarchaeota archaeon]|nr:hypothetical protein [Candidatus Aenigmarchaeota archaeon]
MVKIKVLNENGHTELELKTEEATSYIAEQIAAGKWVFKDGMFQPAADSIEDDSEVIITDRLVGG